MSGAFETATEHSTRAEEVVHQISAAEGGASWPFFNDRYLRPDTIVLRIELLEESADKWMGSSNPGPAGPKTCQLNATFWKPPSDRRRRRVPRAGGRVASC